MSLYNIVCLCDVHMCVMCLRPFTKQYFWYLYCRPMWIQNRGSLSTYINTIHAEIALELQTTPLMVHSFSAVSVFHSRYSMFIVPI